MPDVSLRIDVWRAFRVLVLTLALPVGVAILFDLIAGLLPFTTIVAVLICIPLATVLVNRTVLAEMDRVIAIVAPEPAPAGDESSAETEMGHLAAAAAVEAKP